MEEGHHWGVGFDRGRTSLGVGFDGGGTSLGWALIEEVHHWGWALRFCSFTPLPVTFLCFPCTHEM